MLLFPSDVLEVCECLFKVILSFTIRMSFVRSRLSDIALYNIYCYSLEAARRDGNFIVMQIREVGVSAVQERPQKHQNTSSLVSCG